jgi:hypothetical protein
MQKLTVDEQAPIVIEYRNADERRKRNWVGLYVDDNSGRYRDYLSYVYLPKRSTSGTVELPGLPPGNYVARLFFNDSYELEHEVFFTVDATLRRSCPEFADFKGDYLVEDGWLNDWHEGSMTYYWRNLLRWKNSANQGWWIAIHDGETACTLEFADGPYVGSQARVEVRNGSLAFKFAGLWYVKQ